MSPSPPHAFVNRRLAVPEEVTAVSIALTRAFAGDPYFEWLVEGGSARERRTAAMFASDLRHIFLPRSERKTCRAARSGVSSAEIGSRRDSERGVAEVVTVDDVIAGVALWEAPGFTPGLRYALASFPSILAVAGTRLPEIWSGLASIEKLRPKTPHWYLHTIAVNPSYRGLGLSRRLLDDRLAHADATGIPVYLESSKPANVPIYERFGFATTAEVTMPAADGVGPLIVCMERRPRA